MQQSVLEASQIERQETEGLPVRSMEERRRILEQETRAFAGQDGRIAVESPTAAVVTKGKPVSHPLHPILTGFTLGLWGLVWLTLVKTQGERSWRLTVDEYGEVTTQRI